MKKLITIVLLSVLFVNMATAQDEGAVVVGTDIKIASNGIMYSKGTVHVKHVGDTVSVEIGENKDYPLNIHGKIDNDGKLSLESELIFYSDNKRDGLLRQGSATSTVNLIEDAGGDAPRVIVRKYFPVSNFWYTISFPFDVKLSDVKLPSGAEAVYYTNYAAQWYDAQNRANTGLNTGNWKTYKTADKPAVWEAGKAYKIAFKWTDPTKNYLDFIADDAVAGGGNDVDSLFLYANKTRALKYYSSNNFLSNESFGWNVIGGLNPCSFVVNGTNVDFAGGPSTEPIGCIYYYNQTKANWDVLPLQGSSANLDSIRGGDEEIPATDLVILSPYNAFFVQTDPSHLQFTYKTSGYSLGNATPTGFRSSEESENDIMVVALMGKNAAATGNYHKMYLMFNNLYNEGFKLGEDGVLMSEDNPSNPLLWAIHTSETVYNLSVNRLPMVRSREIPLGVTFPANGTYTFAQSKNSDSFMSAILWDKKTNTRTELLRDAYTITAEKGTVSDRFVLIINMAPTSLDEMATTDIYAYTENNILTVKNITIGDQIQVVDVAGRVLVSEVAVDTQFSTVLAQKGAYIVNVMGQNPAVLKVLNK